MVRTMPVRNRVTLIRGLAQSASLAAALGALQLFVQVAAVNGFDWIDALRAALVTVATFWLARARCWRFLARVAPHPAAVS